MIQQNIRIGTIPAILWGEKSNKLFIAVHGNMSNKADDVINIFAKEAISKGYQVLSFDLPEHGDRKNQPQLCKVQTCVKELRHVMQYTKTISENISVFACSIGAYFSLLAYKDQPLQQCLFLSPVVNMKCIIDNIMNWFSINKEQLEEKSEIATPIGQTLYWDYYCYVNEHPIKSWNNPTSILYGLKDNLCEHDIITGFAKKFKCNLHVMEHGEHYFHTTQQLNTFKQWTKKYIL